MQIPRTIAKDVHFLGLPMSQFIGLGVVHGALFCVGFMGSLILEVKILIFVPFVSFIGCLMFLRKVQKNKKPYYLADFCRFHLLTKGVWKAK